jgi:hypothetical protein
MQGEQCAWNANGLQCPGNPQWCDGAEFYDALQCNGSTWVTLATTECGDGGGPDGPPPPPCPPAYDVLPGALCDLPSSLSCPMFSGGGCSAYATCQCNSGLWSCFGYDSGGCYEGGFDAGTD